MNSPEDHARMERLINLGDDQGVVDMLRRGFDPLQQHNNQLSILLFMKAAQRCGTNVLEEMVEKGVNPLDRNGRGQTALFQAHPRNYAFLLEHKLTLEDRDKDGYTPLIAASRDISRYPRELSHTVEGLLKLGADPNGLDHSYMSPLMHLANGGSGDHAAAVKALVSAGADVHHRDTRGQSSLVYAAVIKTIPAMTVALLECGARFDPRSGQLERIVNASIKSNDIGTLKVLGGHGFDPSADPGKWLNHAFSNNAAAAVLHLLEQGAFSKLPRSESEKWKPKKPSANCSAVLNSYRSRQAAFEALHEMKSSSGSRHEP